MMIGQLLGGRYEILDRIGGGGMALVYKGRDILLHRKVAVKVLRQQYVYDEEFIRRFRREAQSAASLSHPNVVSIYDVGQEDDIHYIVMEYVEGVNLNELIKEKGPLQPDEAVHIASQICDALDHAHHNGIIHRDIKPHNILIGKNGRVKVTDFGIARAATSSTITQTGSVVGSVHYFSPEHAKGIMTGEKSDLYSLGIVLYQMLTGKLPFLGESPISVALKHLQENVEEPRKINPLIPQSVENIILKALRKNPEERYQSAQQMLRDLDTCLSPERRNEPKIVFPETDDEDGEQTRVMPAIRPGRYAADEGRGTEDEEEERDEPIRKGKPWVKPLVWTLVTVALLTGMWFGIAYVKNLFVVPEVDVPSVVNLPYPDAEAKLKAVGLAAEKIPVPSEDVEKDIVIRQDKFGMKVKVNSIIKLYVSEGPKTAKMPNLIGKKWDEVQSELQALELPDMGKQIAKEEVFNDAPAGTILEQTPQPSEEFALKEAQIKLIVSKGRQTRPMPSLLGLSEDQAKAIILQNQLKLSDDIKYEKSYSPKGTVTKQWPFEPDDPVSPGDTVYITVSSGYPDEAITLTYNISVPPAEEGKESMVRILYSDARGNDREWDKRKISEIKTFSVTLVLSPEKDGKIQVIRDDVKIVDKTITYEEAQMLQSGANPASSQSERESAGDERNGERTEDSNAGGRD